MATRRSGDEIDDLANDLIVALSQRLGDRAALQRAIVRWAEVTGDDDFIAIAVTALHNMFADYLVEVPAAEVPADAIQLEVGR